MSKVSIDYRPWYLPPGLCLSAYEDPPETLRLLWWVARARSIDAATLAGLCWQDEREARWALWQHQHEGSLRLAPLPADHRQGAILTNGGLARLARWAALDPACLARHVGWGFAEERWAEEGPEAIADGWYDPARRPGAHRLAVLALLGRAARESEPEAFWGLKLEEVWLEREAAGVLGKCAPRPDAVLVWRVRGDLVYRYVVELELGSQRPGAVAAKLEAYARYRASGAWRAQGWGKFPGVLFVCASALHETRLARVLSSVNARLGWPLAVLLTHQGYLARYRLLDPIWRAAGAAPTPPDLRATIWGRDDAALMQFRREIAEQARDQSRYRMGGKT